MAKEPATSERINWKGADLRASDLRGTNFTGTNLRYADLRGASLQGANFQNASLYGARKQLRRIFAGPICGWRISVVPIWKEP
jgi:uncharacterized protein YjbI with pentapeptide repeats